MKSPVILITGASQGIGAALARVFAAEVPGVRLALVARNRRKLAAVARACVTSGSRAGTAPATPEIFPCDVTNEAAVSGLAKSVSGRFGGVDVLINNAGAFAGAPLTRMSVTAFDQIIAANLRSVFLVSRAFLPGMVRRRRGDVFNMSSIAAQTAYPGGAAYSAAKAGVAALSRVMRAEFKTKGVRVCCVFPGATWSPSWAGTGIPAGRMMPAEDVARAFLDVYRLTRRTVVEEIALRPQLGDV